MASFAPPPTHELIKLAIRPTAGSRFPYALRALCMAIDADDRAAWITPGPEGRLTVIESPGHGMEPGMWDECGGRVGGKAQGVPPPSAVSRLQRAI